MPIGGQLRSLPDSRWLADPLTVGDTGGFGTAGRSYGIAAAAPGSRRLQGQSLEVRFTQMLGTLGALGRTELIIRIDLMLELIQHRFACISSSGRAVFGVSPGFMGCDLSA